MKWIHILAGLISIVAGFIALYSLKGGRLHRKSGTVFAYAMLLMSGTGAVMAVFLKPNPGNVVAGTLTFYLVSTGLLTVLRRVEQIRGPLIGFMLAALAVSVVAFRLGFEALGSANGIVPAPPLFMFASIGLLAAGGDARMLWAGHIEGARRLARHLWRMTYALWIATTSLFLGQARHFPTPLRHIGLLAIPVLLVTVTLFYWLVRVRMQRRSVMPSRIEQA